MKKYYKILLATLIISILLVGCNTKEQLSAFYIKGTKDSNVHSENINETELWTSEKLNFHIENRAVQNMTVEFEGKKYSGKYKHSMVELGTNYTIDEYDFENGYFQINSLTGELHSIHFILPTTDKKNISIEQGAVIAEKIAKKYINKNNYEFAQTDMNYFYSYVYKKKLNNIYTYEKLAVTVNYNGEITGYAFFMGNAFPNPDETEKYDERIKELTSDKAVELVNKAVEERYPATIEYSAPYSIVDKRIVLDQNNNLCMLYKIEVESAYDKNVVDEYGNLMPVFDGALDFILIK